MRAQVTSASVCAAGHLAPLTTDATAGGTVGVSYSFLACAPLRHVASHALALRRVCALRAGCAIKGPQARVAARRCRASASAAGSIAASARAQRPQRHMAAGMALSRRHVCSLLRRALLLAPLVRLYLQQSPVSCENGHLRHGRRPWPFARCNGCDVVRPQKATHDAALKRGVQASAGLASASSAACSA